MIIDVTPVNQTRESSTFNQGLDGPFSEAVKRHVWEKAPLIPGKESRHRTVRQDKYGNEIRWHRFGSTRSPYGWEIDHCRPVVYPHYGTDHLNNLQPLHWTENRLKGNHYPYGTKRRKRLLDRLGG